MSGRHLHLQSEGLGSALSSPQASAGRKGRVGMFRCCASVQGELAKRCCQEKYLHPLHTHQPTRKVSSCLQWR